VARKFIHAGESHIMLADLYEDLHKLYKLDGQKDKALQALEQHVKIKGEMSLKEVDQRIEAIKALSDVRERKEQLLQAENEIALKKQELQLATLYLHQKTELIDDFESFLLKLRKENYQKNKLFKALHDKLRNAQINTTENEAFKEKINEGNLKFILRLRELHPDISKTEAQVASLLRSGMNTKEISDLLIIDARSVEMHRYRLRKKLKLNRSDDLLMILNRVGE
jgi:DNA-binding CsgD family transcriptional regulator